MLSGTYKLTFDDKVISYPQANMACSYEIIPVRRYERTLFTTGVAVSAGTLNDNIHNYDEILIGCGFPDGSTWNTKYGTNYNYFDLKLHNNDTFNLQNTITNGTANNAGVHYIYMARFVFNTANNSFTVDDGQATTAALGWLETPAGTNATLTGKNNGSRLKMVKEVIGVKYQ